MNKATSAQSFVVDAHSRRDDIDGLRAVAVVAVLIFHAFPAALPGGYLGVDVFFVISGFVITRLLLIELRGRSSINLVAFYGRRIRRIFPALCIVLVATLALGWVVLTQSEWQQLLRHTVAAATMTSNLVYRAEVGYFDQDADHKPLLHLWSLGIEEQFYLVLPVALLVLWRVRPLLKVGLALAVALSFAYSAYASIGSRGDFYSPIARGWELGLGTLLALGGPDLFSRARIRSTLSVAGIVMISAAFVWPRPTILPDALLPTAGAAMVIWAGPAAWFNVSVLARRPAVWIGLISYPLYLWHWPLLSYAAISGYDESPQGVAIKIAILGLSVVLADVTYRMVEQRLRNTGPLLVAPPFAGAMVAIAVFAVMSPSLLTWTSALRLSERDPSVWRADLINTADCIERYQIPTGDAFCIETLPGTAPTFAIIGDSHSNHWTPGIKAVNPDLAALQIGAGGCIYAEVESYGPADDAAHQAICGALMRRTFAVIRSTPSINTVILSARLIETFPADPATAPRRLIGSATTTQENLDAFVPAVRSAVKELVASGRRVVFLLPIPELQIDPRTCLHLRAVQFQRSDCGVPEIVASTARAKVVQAIHLAAEGFPEVEIVDPWNVFCRAGWCDAWVDGEMVYRDNNHLSETGAARVWSEIAAHFVSAPPGQAAAPFQAAL